jgi:hypothetical protein
MEPTVTITIPSSWLGNRTLDQSELRRALQLGLTQLRQQRVKDEATVQVVQALLNTRRIRHLAVPLAEGEERETGRQEPPTLPGPPASEILIAQRRGEM